MSEGYFSDNAHMLITGVTGAMGDYTGNGDGGTFGGKSALATWWCDNPGRERDLVVFGNFKHDDVAEVTGFTEVNSVEELADAMGRGERRLVLTPSDSDWEAVSTRLREFIQALPAELTKLVVLDEAPELDNSEVLTFVRVLGNMANCKTLVISQSAKAVTNDVVQQSVLVWVGPMDSDYQPWFRTHDYQRAYDYIQANHEPYHWTVVFGSAEGEWRHYEPVPAEYGEV